MQKVFPEHLSFPWQTEGIGNFGKSKGHWDLGRSYDWSVSVYLGSFVNLTFCLRTNIFVQNNFTAHYPSALKYRVVCPSDILSDISSDIFSSMSSLSLRSGRKLGAAPMGHQWSKTLRSLSSRLLVICRVIFSSFCVNSSRRWRTRTLRCRNSCENWGRISRKAQE